MRCDEIGCETVHPGACWADPGDMGLVGLLYQMMLI